MKVLAFLMQSLQTILQRFVNRLDLKKIVHIFYYLFITLIMIY